MARLSQRAEHKLRLDSSEDDERAEVRVLAYDYMQRTGLNVADLGKRINYAHGTVRIFLSDRWHRVAGTSKHICRAIREYIAAHPIAPPTQPFGELYETENVRAMRLTFVSLLMKPVAYMVYAPPGSQKSFTLENLVAELNRQEMSRNGSGRRTYYVYATVRMTPTQVMWAVALACGIPGGGDALRIARNLSFEFRDRRVLLAVDEAQHRSIDSLECLRAFLDRPPNFSLLLAGSHDLHRKFDRLSSVLGQWNSRIIKKVKLPGVSAGG